MKSAKARLRFLVLVLAVIAFSGPLTSVRCGYANAAGLHDDSASGLSEPIQSADDVEVFGARGRQG